MTTSFVLGVVLAVMMPLASCTAAVAILRAPGWPSRVPPVTMLTLVLMLFHVQAPQPHLVAVAIGAWMVIALANLARLHTLSVLAIVTCGAASALLFVPAALAGTWPVRALPGGAKDAALELNGQSQGP